jgi:ATP-dependent 26S proteasome regulatory subunit
MENLDDLQTSYDDITIDADIRDVIEHPVSMSSLQTDSSGLIVFRSLYRSKGALLYGPPGTGKTNLSHAVTCDSDAHMLAINAT